MSKAGALLIHSSWGNFTVEGTDFQIKVWKALSQIPYGEVRTYKEIASSIGHPKAVRAVGQACGANPVPVVIPCHRVVAQNGLGGFSGGLEFKKKLLQKERGKIA